MPTIVITIALLVSLLWTTPAGENMPQNVPKAPETVDIATLITNHAKIAHFDEIVALRIADCESKMGKYRENWEGSGAIGLFQFKPSTWNAYCEGDINNDEDQIRCFLQLYPLHKDWWQCS